MWPISNTLANEGFGGLKTLDQHRTNRWQSGRPDEQNYIAPGTNAICQRWDNNTANKMSTLAQGMTDIYVYMDISKSVHVSYQM